MKILNDEYKNNKYVIDKYIKLKMYMKMQNFIKICERRNLKAFYSKVLVY